MLILRKWKLCKHQINNVNLKQKKKKNVKRTVLSHLQKLSPFIVTLPKRNMLHKRKPVVLSHYCALCNFNHLCYYITLLLPRDTSSLFPFPPPVTYMKQKPFQHAITVLQGKHRLDLLHNMYTFTANIIEYVYNTGIMQYLSFTEIRR